VRLNDKWNSDGKIKIRAAMTANYLHFRFDKYLFIQLPLYSDVNVKIDVDSDVQKARFIFCDERPYVHIERMALQEDLFSFRFIRI
jgi:hypothetical protein